MMFQVRFLQKYRKFERVHNTVFCMVWFIYGINEVNVKTYKLPMEGYQTVFHCSGNGNNKDLS